MLQACAVNDGDGEDGDCWLEYKSRNLCYLDQGEVLCNDSTCPDGPCLR